jgi:hypothetical protein
LCPAVTRAPSCTILCSKRSTMPGSGATATGRPSPHLRGWAAAPACVEDNKCWIEFTMLCVCLP